MSSIKFFALILGCIFGVCYAEHETYHNESLADEISELVDDVKAIVPIVEQMVGYLGNSSTCASDLMEIVKATYSKEQWAIKYFDSFAKIPTAVLMISLNWLGAYRECRQVKKTYEIEDKSHTFNGQYCTLVLPQAGAILSKNPLAASFSLQYGFCLPDSCQGNDIARLVHQYAEQLPELYQSVLQKVTVECQPNEKHWEWRGIFGLSLVSFFVLIATLATIYDVAVVRKLLPSMRNTDTDDKTSSNVSFVNSACNDPESDKPMEKTTVQVNPPTGLIADLAQTFSVYTNALKILNTDSSSEGTLSCVHGIRFLSMTWVILGHTYAFVSGFTTNIVAIMDAVNEPIQVVTTAGFYSVDSFFLLSGTLVTYLFLRQAKKLGGIKKIPWIQFYVHRFWRLTPAYMLIMGLYVCLAPYLGSGPMWKSNGFEKGYCASNWWKNLLYINNLFPKDFGCMGWSWYLANDMQFYVISPLFLIPFALFPIAGFAVVGALLLACWISTGLILTHFNIVNSHSTGTFTDNSAPHFMMDYYIRPWTRIGPYLIGAILGYILYKTDCKLKLPKVVVLIGWALAAAMNLSLVYGVYKAHPSELTVKVLYTLGRTAWSIGVAWVILCCCTGYGGIVNHILSWKALIPLSRLTYCAYLVHPWVIYTLYSGRNTLVEGAHIVMIVYYLGFVMIAFMVAFVASLLFEAPMIGLEKTIKKSRKK